MKPKYSKIFGIVSVFYFDAKIIQFFNLPNYLQTKIIPRLQQLKLEMNEFGKTVLWSHALHELEAHRRDTNKSPILLAILDSYCYLWLRRKYFHSEIKRKASFPFVFHSFIRIFAER